MALKLTFTVIFLGLAGFGLSVGHANDLSGNGICKMGFLREWKIPIEGQRVSDILNKFKDEFKVAYFEQRGGLFDFAGYDDCLYVSGNKGCGPLIKVLTDVKNKYDAKITTSEKPYAPDVTLMPDARLKAHVCCQTRHSEEVCVKEKGHILFPAD